MANVVSYLSYQHMPSGAQSHVGKYGIVVSGTYTQGTGETVSLLTATNPNGYELNGAVPMGFFDENFPEVVQSNIGGYETQISAYAAGVFNLKFFTTAGGELATGTYPTAISGGSVAVSVPNRI